MATKPMWVQDPDNPSLWRRWNGKRLLGPGTPNGRVWAVTAQLLGVVTSVFGPLVIMVTVGRRSRFVKHHSVEAFNYQLTIVMIQIALLFGGIVLAWPVYAAAGSDTGSMVLDVITVVGWIVFIGMEIYAVYAAVQARKGRWNTYRFCIRLIPGAERAPRAISD
jgi:uncharacterized Tic20 family protein